MQEFTQRITKNIDTPPRIDPTAFIAPNVFIAGDVRIGPKASIWPGCSLRGDIRPIEIGEGSNVQDGSVVHVDDEHSAIIGSYVTIGHKAIIHACTIEDESLIGMGAIILDGAVIGARSIVGANATVTKGTIVPPGSLVLGSPAKVVRTLDEAAQKDLRRWAERYVILSRTYMARQPGGPGTAIVVPGKGSC